MKFFLWFRSITRHLFLFGIALIIVGLLFSKLLISIGSFTILGTWIIDWEMKAKFRSFFKDPVAIGFSLLFLIHIVGLLYTYNVEYAMKDIRIKLPLMLFPLVFSTSKRLSVKEFDFFKMLFITTILASTFVSTYFYMWGGDYYATNSRNISVFISHIRLSLIICLAIYFCIDLYRRYSRTQGRYSMFLVVGWFIFFLFMAQYLTGIVILLLSSLIIIFRFLIVSRKKKWLISLLSFMVLTIALGIYKLTSLHKEFLAYQTLKDLPFEKGSAGGEDYVHPGLYDKQPHYQNGYMVYKNVARDEFKRTWNQRSSIEFEGNTIHGYPIKDVALWYLTSKGMKKDSVAVMSLTDEEIHAIENGISNHQYLNRNGLEVRVLETYWEIQNYIQGGDYNGHSVTMRLVFWKTALQIFNENWLIGVGTGDIDDAFSIQYEKTNSILEDKWRLRTHNQYLTFLATFGALGIIVILYSFFVPFFKGRISFLYLAFATIIFISMLNEDTLETQVGVTIFAFFNGFIYFLQPQEPNNK